MKKVVMCAVIGAVLNVGEGMAMESRLTRVGENSIATTSENFSTITVRSGERAEVEAINRDIRYNYFEFNGDNVSVSFSRGIVDGEEFITLDTFRKEYPYEKIFKGLDSADENHSYAVYEIFADTQELGRLLLCDEFVDEDNPLDHFKRDVNVVNNDDELVTTKDIETYVKLGGKEFVIGTTRNIRFPYAVLGTERDEGYTAAPDGGDNVRIYVRWNGEEVRRAWDGLALVEKPPVEPPIENPPAPQRVEQTQHSGPSNEFQRLMQAVEREDPVARTVNRIMPIPGHGPLLPPPPLPPLPIPGGDCNIM